MRWNLRMKAAERGIWKSTELRRMLAEHGLTISAGKMSGLWTGTPTTIRLDDLDVICFVLGCTPADLLICEPEAVATRKPANKAAAANAPTTSSSGPTGRRRPTPGRSRTKPPA